MYSPKNFQMSGLASTEEVARQAQAENAKRSFQSRQLGLFKTISPMVSVAMLGKDPAEKLSIFKNIFHHSGVVASELLREMKVDMLAMPYLVSVAQRHIAENVLQYVQSTHSSDVDWHALLRLQKEVARAILQGPAHAELYTDQPEVQVKLSLLQITNTLALGLQGIVSLEKKEQEVEGAVRWLLSSLQEDLQGIQSSLPDGPLEKSALFRVALAEKTKVLLALWQQEKDLQKSIPLVSQHWNMVLRLVAGL